MEFQALLDTAIDWLSAHGLRLVLIVVLAFLVSRVAGIFVNRMFTFIKADSVGGEREKRARTLSSLVRYAPNITIVIVALIMILGEFGITIGPILAAAGVAGVALGFGAQHLVQDVIAGFFILMEDQIRVGDVVTVSGKGGIVERITLRMVILRNLAGEVHYIRNGLIDVVTNKTKEFSFSVFDIGVAYREDVDEVMEVIKTVGAELKEDVDFGADILEPVEVLGLDQFADSAVVIKARIKTKPIKQWRIMREFNRRLKIAFDQRKIEIPFPHTTLYMGVDKDGQAPPINVAISKQA